MIIKTLVEEINNEERWIIYDAIDHIEYTQSGLTSACKCETCNTDRECKIHMYFRSGAYKVLIATKKTYIMNDSGTTIDKIFV